MKRPFASKAVADAFLAYPKAAQPGLLRLRDLVFDVAEDTPEAGRIEESLRWGQPAYLTPETKSSSTLRLGVPKDGDGFAIYAHCGSSIISTFAETFPGQDKIEGNRAVHFGSVDQIDPARHGMLIRHALTYHLKK
ncbi:DUF1801 domain-containing protein [Thalassococcus sp. S3]|uniref:DUF1801 domain-containing protein n=1 Tax=Thalassococcus sp. S3 TaxID=2017482 RepID=UPI0010246DC2|nr:DUF1801 domain-containing protein [Thalassococcus sp. S3]QBF29733.1 hypothetical protein CFI11_00690 [Thalassococcus sp. S3]